MSEVSVPIPDEAREAAWAALQRFIVGREGDRNGVDVMLDAVAPLIARAAQIQVLRRIWNRYDNIPCDVQPRIPIEWIEEMMEELGEEP